MRTFVNMVDNNFWFADRKAGRGGYVPLIGKNGEGS